MGGSSRTSTRAIGSTLWRYVVKPPIFSHLRSRSSCLNRFRYPLFPSLEKPITHNAASIMLIYGTLAGTFQALGETCGSSVNRNDRQRKIRKFLFAELFARLIIDLVRNVIVRDQDQCFRPCQSGSFPFAVIGRLSPGYEAVKVAARFSACSRILAVHIDAIGAAVDLRCSQLD